MATGTYDRERELTAAITPAVESALPGVEVLAVELLSPARFCVYVDHPSGVDFALCERVTRLLDDYRADWAIDVSSPGPERPIRRPEHFRRAIGGTVKLKTTGSQRVRGTLLAADDDAVTVSVNGTSQRDPGRRHRPGQPDRRGTGVMSQEIIEGIRTIEKEKGIETGTLVAALEDALLAAYKKTPGAARHATVELDDEGEFRVFALDIPTDLEERLRRGGARARDRRARADRGGDRREAAHADRRRGARPRLVAGSRQPRQPHRRDADDFGRIAAMTAKQVIQQRIREAERAIMYDEYVDRQGEVVTGIVQQAGDRNNVLVDLGKVEALLPRSEQVDGERYEQGSRIKAVIIEVRSGTKGPQVILSRRAPQLIETLFELEVPEIADGLVEIRGVAREPGYRSKIAVESHVQGVDPVGACVGPRGSRVRMVVSELRGEKIDIIPWNTEPARFVAKALSPARVREVYIDDESRDATVVVPDDQLALAIGKEGLNARLATRLTGWKIDIKSDTEFAQAEAKAAFAGEDDGDDDFSGRCSALLSNGKRCPNTALPGSKYCGVPAHQALATDPVAAAAQSVAIAEEAGRRGRGGARCRRARPQDEADAAEEADRRRPPRSRSRRTLEGERQPSRSRRRRATTRERLRAGQDVRRAAAAGRRSRSSSASGRSTAC